MAGPCSTRGGPGKGSRRNEPIAAERYANREFSGAAGCESRITTFPVMFATNT